MHFRVSKWGNGLGIRILRSIAEEVGIKEGTAIEFTAERNSILIQKSKYHLELLLAQINSENMHSEVDSHSPVGKEVW